MLQSMASRLESLDLSPSSHEMEPAQTSAPQAPETKQKKSASSKRVRTAANDAASARSDRRRPRATPPAEPAPLPRLENWEAEPRPQRYMQKAFEGVVRFTIPSDFRRVLADGCTTVTVPLSPRLTMRIFDYGLTLDALDKGREHAVTGTLTIRRNPKKPWEVLSVTLDVNNLPPEYDVARVERDTGDESCRLPAGVITQYRFCRTHTLDIRRIAQPAEA